MEDGGRALAHLMTFAEARDFADSARLAVHPPPASVHRVFMLFECLTCPRDMAGCTAEARGDLGAVVRRAGGRFAAPSRGLAVLEWGGMKVVR
jgi:hypothetical protein